MGQESARSPRHGYDAGWQRLAAELVELVHQEHHCMRLVRPRLGALQAGDRIGKQQADQRRQGFQEFPPQQRLSAGKRDVLSLFGAGELYDGGRGRSRAALGTPELRRDDRDPR